MSEWIKFDDKMPKLGVNIWISDGKNSWPSVYLSMVRLSAEIYWKERINPEPPEKEKHECTFIEYGKRFKCFESSEGFVLTINDADEDLNKTDIDNFLCTVKFCPFCGFTLGDK